ncbi:MAG: DUF493 domain-containing protein [Deferrisomatales bacterium]|nr:DUF493 domain-containing protein [Deferrisomatales bacterium]
MAERSVPIEDLLEFPTPFEFKAVGPNQEAFVAAVEATARDALGASRTLERRTRTSRNGTYLSVTLSTRVENADELRAVYAGLRTVPGVITVL